MRIAHKDPTRLFGLVGVMLSTLFIRAIVVG